MKFVCLVAVTLSGSPVFAHQSVLSGVAHELDHGPGMLALAIGLSVVLSTAYGAVAMRKRQMLAKAQ